MIHPMRVEWSEPDREKRAAANTCVSADIANIRAAGMALAGLADLERALLLCQSDEEKFTIWARRYPDLNAETLHYGTLLSVRYVPAQYGVTYDQRSGRATTHELCKSKWVALVATADGTKEMDPMTLRVMWPMSAGDPIGGMISPDELRRRRERGEP